MEELERGTGAAEGTEAQSGQVLFWLREQFPGRGRSVPGPAPSMRGRAVCQALAVKPG